MAKNKQSKYHRYGVTPIGNRLRPPRTVKDIVVHWLRIINPQSVENRTFKQFKQTRIYKSLEVKYSVSEIEEMYLKARKALFADKMDVLR